MLTQLLVAPGPAAATTTIVPYQATGYRYLEVPAGQEPSGWQGSSFDESSWGTGDAAFGSGGGCPLQGTVQTNWDVNTDMLLRKQITLPSGASGVTIDVTVDNDAKVYWNETLVGSATHENCPAYNDWVFSVPDNLLASGSNLLAVQGSDNGFERFLDVSVSAESEPSPDQPLTSLGTLGPSTGVIGSSVSVGWDFSDADPAAVASDFTATIDWGDGTTASGGVTTTCVGQQCFFLVGNAHVYLSTGTFTAVAHVKDQIGRHDSGGATIDIPATIVVGPAVPPPPADDKKTGGKVAAGLGIVAGGLGVCAAGALVGVVTAPVAAGCAAGIAVLGIGAGIAAWFSIDPPEMNFTHVALPSPLSVRRVQSGRGLTKRAARAFTAFAANGGAEIGVGQAMMHAVERAQGAALASQPGWVHVQLRAAEKYADQLARLVKREISLRKTLVLALRASRVPNLRVTATAVRRLQKRIARHGLPKTFTKAIHASPEEIAALRTVLLKLAPTQASGRLFNQIAGKGTLAVLAQWATTLTAEATRLRDSKLG